MARAVETSRPLIDARKHELTVTLPREPLLMSADPVRLAQVLANLLNNAAKYTEEGGKIALDVARIGDEAVFRVRDNGIGISPEMLSCSSTCSPRSTARSTARREGLGIGLTLVRRLVEMHGGTVQAFSAGTNRGSEFVIRLPALDEPLSLDWEDPASSGQTDCFVPRRILLVDDHRWVAESLMKLLKLGGHDVRIAGDGPSALEEVSIFRPDIALLDIGLPGMDGYELAQCIPKQHGDRAHDLDRPYGLWARRGSSPSTGGRLRLPRDQARGMRSPLQVDFFGR